MGVMDTTNMPFLPEFISVSLEETGFHWRTPSFNITKHYLLRDESIKRGQLTDSSPRASDVVHTHMQAGCGSRGDGHSSVQVALRWC